MEDIPFIVWKEEYSVGHKKLDNQHKTILNVINRLYKNIQKDIASEEIKNILWELTQYAKNHLVYEEEIMREIGFPDLTVHKKFHQSYIDNTDNLVRKFRASDPDIAFETMKFLKNWWVEHIVSMDKKYAPYITPQDNKD
jgi:hemerythrin